jgi:hypothetical protein
MQRSKFLGAAILAGLITLSARARADEIPHPEGPVWDMTFVHTEYAHERDYERYLPGAYTQIQEEEGKKQDLLLADGIPLRLDGILCHALFVFTLLFSVVPKP